MSKRRCSVYEKYILEDFDFAPDEPEKFPDSYALSAADWGVIKHVFTERRARTPALNLPEHLHSHLVDEVQSAVCIFLHRALWREQQQEDFENTRKDRLRQIKSLREQLAVDRETEKTSANAVYHAVNNDGRKVGDRLLESLTEAETALVVLKPATKQGRSNPHVRALVLRLAQIYAECTGVQPSYTEHEDMESRFVAFVRAVFAAIDNKQLLPKRLAYDDTGTRVSLKHLAQRAVEIMRETENIDAERDSSPSW